MAIHRSLSATVLSSIDALLAGTDTLLEHSYPGDDGSRQPVHTVYVPADTFTPELPSEWGKRAIAAVDSWGDLTQLGALVGAELSSSDLSSRIDTKLRREPIEDLRLDFEDGYGDRGDDVEDADAIEAAHLVSAAVAEGVAPSFIGIRFKSFEASTRARGLRTLDLFVSTLALRGGLPTGLTLTLPKVSTTAQVLALDAAASALEETLGLPPGRLRFEVQVETPQLILGADGTSPLAQLPHLVPGRISALHYGTYDYSASLEIAAEYQSMEHPVADVAKSVMQLAVAGTGIRLSDGSTNILPIGDQIEDAWRIHARLVRRSLERGFYQGWDLHPAQLPTRYIATYSFYRNGFARAAGRLRLYLEKTAGVVLDEPATARALAGFVCRGLDCGAIDESEVLAAIGIDRSRLSSLARPNQNRPNQNRPNQHQPN